MEGDSNAGWRYFNHSPPEIPDGVAVVVMCLDVPEIRFVRQCLQRGVHYVDITAEDAILQQIEALNGVAKAGGSTAILSVGLSPGLTNLLARHAQAQFETLHHVDIYGLLGLGEAYGTAAAHWTLQNLNERVAEVTLERQKVDGAIRLGQNRSLAGI